MITEPDIDHRLLVAFYRSHGRITEYIDVICNSYNNDIFN